MADRSKQGAVGHSTPDPRGRPLGPPGLGGVGGGQPRDSASRGTRYGYYARAVAFCALPEERKPRVSDNVACEQYRIILLGNAWGSKLDDLRATLQMVRWVADAKHSEADLERRYRALVALLEVWESGDLDDSGESLRTRFVALKSRFPKIGRAAAREAAERQKKKGPRHR